MTIQLLCQMQEAVTEGDTEQPSTDFAAIAKILFNQRRRRDVYFGSGLFAEPAWDILLDLRTQYDAHRMPASLAVYAATSTSTGLRHLHTLERMGLVERWTDPNDARRRLSRLSDNGTRAMDGYLAELMGSSWPSPSK